MRENCLRYWRASRLEPSWPSNSITVWRISPMSLDNSAIQRLDLLELRERHPFINRVGLGDLSGPQHQRRKARVGKQRGLGPETDRRADCQTMAMAESASHGVI